MIYFERISPEELIQEILQVQPLSDDISSFEILDIITSAVRANNNHEFFEPVFTASEPGQTNLNGSVAPKIHYRVNLELATWTIIGVLLDLYYTKGITTALLAAFGLSGQFINLIPVKKGELCNYLLIKDYQLKKKKEIDEFVSKKKCRFPGHRCAHNFGGICKITNIALKDNLEGLIKKDIIRLERKTLVLNK